MTRLPRGPLTLVLTTAAIAVAGCGGSSGKSSSPPPASIGSGTGTSGPVTSVLPLSTKITSPAYRAFAARGLAQIPGVSTSAIPKILDCVIQKQVSQGITTVAQVKQHRSQVNADGIACVHQAGA